MNKTPLLSPGRPIALWMSLNLLLHAPAYAASEAAIQRALETVRGPVTCAKVLTAVRDAGDASQRERFQQHIDRLLKATGTLLYDQLDDLDERDLADVVRRAHALGDSGLNRIMETIQAIPDRETRMQRLGAITATCADVAQKL